MKKIINGKTYNTATATLIAEYQNGLGNRDFRGYEEALYLTSKGAYFIAGEGGPMTDYAQSCGQNSWSGGSNIFLQTKAQALAWCEKRNIDTDTVEKYFTIEEG